MNHLLFADVGCNFRPSPSRLWPLEVLISNAVQGGPGMAFFGHGQQLTMSAYEDGPALARMNTRAVVTT